MDLALDFLLDMGISSKNCGRPKTSTKHNASARGLLSGGTLGLVVSLRSIYISTEMKFLCLEPIKFVVGK